VLRKWLTEQKMGLTQPVCTPEALPEIVREKSKIPAEISR